MAQCTLPPGDLTKVKNRVKGRKQRGQRGEEGIKCSEAFGR